MGITERQNTPNIDYPGFNKVTIQMQAAKTSDPLAARVSDVLTDFVEWLDRYGEKSWDHQSFSQDRSGDEPRHSITATDLLEPQLSRP